MGENTKIQWTDYTFNPWRGCTKVHAGCTHCYAEREAKRFPQNRGIWGPNGTRVKASEAMWKEPLKWNRDAERAGERKRVFCASLADVFEEWGGPITDHNGRQLFTINGQEGFTEPDYPECRPVSMEDLRRRLLHLIDETPHLDWQLVTKRPENVRGMWPHHAGPWIKEGKACVDSWHRSNAWLLTSISDQPTADAMIPELGESCHLVPVLGLSIEPLLGPIDLSPWLRRQDALFDKAIDWVIIGGESGPAARPCNIDSHGGGPDEWPEDLRVREFPSVEVPAVRDLAASIRLPVNLVRAWLDDTERPLFVGMIVAAAALLRVDARWLATGRPSSIARAEVYGFRRSRSRGATISNRSADRIEARLMLVPQPAMDPLQCRYCGQSADDWADDHATICAPCLKPQGDLYANED